MIGAGQGGYVRASRFASVYWRNIGGLSAVDSTRKCTFSIDKHTRYIAACAYTQRMPVTEVYIFSIFLFMLMYLHQFTQCLLLEIQIPLDGQSQRASRLLQFLQQEVP